MSYASRKPQSRAETEAHARTLRALVKVPENKVCADCKRNDTRWASWNLGCFLCIRCSGIHRSMGTHISRVKSIDLDLWTPEQMDSIQKWGNRRANAYWEAHLKPGHVPADHKIESFIRSKYESRRWAREGPPPSDPAVLDGAASPAVAPSAAPAPTPTASAPAARPAATPLLDLLDDEAPVTKPAAKATPAPAPAPAVRPTPSGAGLFDLDWDDAASHTRPQPAAAPHSTTLRGKEAILSLFSAPAPAPAPTSVDSAVPTRTALSAAAPASFTAASVPGPQRTAPPPGDLFNTQDVWGSSTTTTQAPPSDAFADIWGDFK